MYIHIGGDITLPSDKIIGIFDIEKTSVNKDVNDYLMKLQKQGRIYYVSCDIYLKCVCFYAEKAVCG